MRLGLTRRNIGRLVLLAWAIALAWLARRELSKEDAAATAERVRRLEPDAQYFAVLIGGRQIGQLNLATDTLVDGVRLTEQLVLDLPVGDSTRQLARGGVYFLSRSLRLRQYTRNDFGIGPAERLDLAIGADSILSVNLSEAGNQRAGQLRRRIDPEVILPAMLSYRVAFGPGLSVGESLSLPLLELGTTETRTLRVRVAAESTFIVPDSAVWDAAADAWVPATSDTVRAWRLEHDAPGGPTISWVDQRGALVHQETAGGLTLRRSAFDIVGNNYRRLRRSESAAWRLQIPAVQPLTSLGRAPEIGAGRRQFQVQLGSPADSLPSHALALSGGRQSLRGDTLTVSRETPAAAVEEAAPRVTDPAWDAPAGGSGMNGIVREAAGGARTLRDSAAALTRWVATRIATEPALTGFGTALTTLLARRGGADGKARLLVSLARTAGIPARVVSGVAVLPEGTFSHSWAELWLGRWVAADPSHGQLPASASLIRLRVGERSRPIDLLPVAGSARFLPLRPAR